MKLPLFLLLSALGTISNLVAEPVYTTNFRSFDEGPLAGQGDWKPVAKWVSPLIQSLDNTMVVGANPDSKNALTFAMQKIGDLDLPDDKVIYVDVKLMKNLVTQIVPATCAVGFGDRETLETEEAYFGVVHNRWSAWTIQPVNTKDEPIVPPLDQWIYLRVAVNPAANNGIGGVRMSIRGDGEIDHTPLYFDAAQNQETVLIDLRETPPSSWTHLGVMLGGGVSTTPTGDQVPRVGLIDEISVSIGEAETW